MRDIRFNWKVNGNKLNISLDLFNVVIEVKKNTDRVFYSLQVIDENTKKLLFNFYTLEEAIYFTESVIYNCKDNTEVLDEYLDWFDKMYGYQHEEGKVMFTPEEIKEVVAEYFGYNKSYRVSVEDKINLVDNNLTVTYYLIEYLNHNGINNNIKTRLTNGDLNNAFNFFLEDLDYEVEDFKYITDYSQEKPVFEGIELKVNKLEDEKVLRRF